MVFQSIFITSLMLVVLTLTGCGGSDGVPGNDNNSGSAPTGGTQAAYQNRHVPQSIGIKIPDTLLGSTASTQQLRSTKAAGDFGISGTSGAYWELRGHVSSLKTRLDEARFDFIALDAIWDQIQNYCQGTAEAADCNIPAGQLTFVMTEAMSNAVIEQVKQSIEAYGGEFTQEELQLITSELPPVGTQIPTGPITFVKNPQGIYDYVITATEIEDDDDFDSNYNFTLKWNEAKDKIEYIDSGSETNDLAQFQYRYSSALKYSADAAGDSIQINETSESNSAGFIWKDTTRLTLKELNNAANGVIITGDFSNNSDDFTSQYHVDGRADNAGGYLKSTNSFDGSNTWHYKESFDGNGNLIAAEQCEATTANFCDSATNWTTVPGYNDIPTDDGYYLDDEDIGNFEEEFGFTLISVGGLPAGEVVYVVVKADATPPFENPESILCYGDQVADVAEGFCFLEADELNAIETKIYVENFEVIDLDTAEYGLSYTLVPGASLNVLDLEG